MNRLDFDKLKSQWAQEGRKIDDNLILDVNAVRQAITSKTAKAFRRHSFWLVVGLLSSVLSTVALLIFIINHLDDQIYLVMATSLMILALAEVITDSRQWLEMKALDFSSSTLIVRKTLDSVRKRRLQMTKWIFLTSILFWWPLVFVIFKGLFNINLIAVVQPSILLASACIGLAFIPVGLFLVSFFSNYFDKSPGFQSFLDGMVGQSFRNARIQMDAIEHFESDIQLHGSYSALERYDNKPKLPSGSKDAMTSLKNRLLASALAYGFLMMLTAKFNVSDSSTWHYLAPGIAMHMVWLSQIICSIEHRIAISKLGFGLSVSEICNRLESMIKIRLFVTRSLVCISPLLCLVFVQALAKAFFNVDLVEMLPKGVVLTLPFVLLIAAVAIFQTVGTKHVYSLANWMSFGSFKQNVLLIETIKKSNS